MFFRWSENCRRIIGISFVRLQLRLLLVLFSIASLGWKDRISLKQPLKSAAEDKGCTLALGSLFGCHGRTAGTTAAAVWDIMNTVLWLKPYILWSSLNDLRPNRNVCKAFSQYLGRKLS